MKRNSKFFPGFSSCKFSNIKRYRDISIWNYAKQNDFTIVTFDEDFNELSTLKGYPPKIIWLRCGNTSTQNIAEKLKSNYNLVIAFLNEDSEEQGCLEIY